jgi:environmental stress-induced protein Ves
MGLGLSIIPRASFAPLPWKNGGGMTYEAIRLPPVGDPFSVARQLGANRLIRTLL